MNLKQMPLRHRQIPPFEYAWRGSQTSKHLGTFKTDWRMHYLQPANATFSQRLLGKMLYKNFLFQLYKNFLFQLMDGALLLLARTPNLDIGC